MTAPFLSYTRDGDVLTIDPIHAYTDKAAWYHFPAGVQRVFVQQEGHSVSKPNSIPAEKTPHSGVWGPMAQV